MQDQEMLTYLTDAAEPPPAVGDALVLRSELDGAEVAAFSPAGRRLGRLPRAECVALGGVLRLATGLAGRVTALVPRPGLIGPARVHVLLFAM